VAATLRKIHVLDDLKTKYGDLLWVAALDVRDNLFSAQPDPYRAKVLPPGVPLLAIEAGASLGWQSYVGPQIAVIGVNTFGASAPGPVVMEHYGFTVENICKKAHDLLRQIEEKP